MVEVRRAGRDVIQRPESIGPVAFAVIFEARAREIGVILAVGIAGYLAIKSVVSLLTGVLVGSFLAVLGVDFPILWGMVAFLFNFIPNIGSILAALPAVAVAWILQGWGTAIVVVAGDVSEAEVRALAEATYGKIPKSPDRAPRQRLKEPEPLAPRTVTLSNPRVTQPSVRRAYLAPSYATAEPGEAVAAPRWRWGRTWRRPSRGSRRSSGCRSPYASAHVTTARCRSSPKPRPWPSISLGARGPYTPSRASWSASARHARS